MYPVSPHYISIFRLPDTHVVAHISPLRLICSIDQKRDPVFGQVVLLLVASSCVRKCRGTLSAYIVVHSICSASRPDASMGYRSVWVDFPSAFVRTAIRWVTVDGNRGE